MTSRNDSKLDLVLPGAIIEYGQAIAAAHAGIRQRPGSPDGRERMAAAEDRLIAMVKGDVTARRMVGIKLSNQDDAERRVRMRVFALLAYRSFVQPASQPLSEISDLASAAMDQSLPPGQAVIYARHIIGKMSVQEVVIACGGSEGGPCNKAVLAAHCMEWINGGKSSFAFLTMAKMVGVTPPDEAEDAKRKDPRAFVSNILRGSPSLTPKSLYDELGRRGYVGQDDARRRLSLAGYRHLVRLRRIYVDGVAPETLPRENILLRGPTGSGKTLLASTLFGGILKTPCIIADMTAFSETGYVGEDPTSLLTRAVLAYGAPIGELAVVILDEIDKVADAGIDGGRTMVSRYGVQRSLLKLLEPGTIEVPTELGSHPYRCKRVRFNTANLLWVGCGAFSNFRKIPRQRRTMGFGADDGCPRSDGGEAASASDMAANGILPELAGRFGLEIELGALGRPDLCEILNRNVFRQYRKELASAGISLLVEPGAIDVLLDRAEARGTGARGLQAEMISSIQDAAFDAYSEAGTDRLVRLYAQNGAVRWEIGRRPPSAKVSMDEIAALVEAPPLEMAEAVS